MGRSLPESLSEQGSVGDEILKGSSPADLPIGRPTKFELVISLQTTWMLGLTVRNKLLVTTDEVIESGCLFVAV